MSYAFTLIDLLKTRDEELHGRSLYIKSLAKPMLSYTQGKFPFYTPHDFHHSETVMENLNWIIPDEIKDKMNNYEIFFLLVAAWLHDWGMLGTDCEDPTSIRENHHIRTEQNFEKMYDKVGLNEHEAHIAGRISKGHRKENLHSNEYDEILFGAGTSIRIRFLAATLRLADETDVTHSRTPEILYYSINPTGFSEEEFKKHLSITGVGQLDEKHIIYLSAIARDPRGAETIRNLTRKIQYELDGMKSILSQYGIEIDRVELKLEARGFVDKPICFEINNGKIVELLIGKHLYGRPDVAIRELVQNAIDTCNTRHLTDINYLPKIIIEKDENSITISDNGIGMGFHEAKCFLSNIGETFYRPEELNKLLENATYDPISQFGIGLLSAFLIADNLIINTKKDGQEGCLFTINSPDQMWKYEKGSLVETGTVIKLLLNDAGKMVDLVETIKHYFISIDIPLWISINNAPAFQFENAWTEKEILKRYIENKNIKMDQNIRTVSKIDTPEFSAFLVRLDGSSRENIVVFNRGIFINTSYIHGLSYRYAVFINLHKSIVDMHISRENIIYNDKWYETLYQIFNALFVEIKKSSDSIEQYIAQTSRIIENRARITIDNIKDNFKYNPLMRAFFYNALFPVVGNKVVYKTLNDIISRDDAIFYKSTISGYILEMELYQKAPNDSKMVFVPYDLPSPADEVEEFECSMELIEYLCIINGKNYISKDLRNILLEKVIIDPNDYKRICPCNVCFATFGELKPLVVVKDFPILSEESPFLGRSYWGNQLLFWKMIDIERVEDYKRCFRLFSDKRYESIKLVQEHTVLIDSSDAFINSILNNYAKFTDEQSLIVYRYFNYLAYLPLIMPNLESLQISVEVIDDLEKQIASFIPIARPQNIFERMEPNGAVYANYLYNNGMEYRFVH